MKIDLSSINLSELERREIERLLEKKNKYLKTDLEQMWYLLDLIWDEYQCDSQNPNWDKIGKFYAHPVWLLNGLFIEQDKVSMQHRHIISNWIVKNNFTKIVDYGGGFGTLARLIAQKSSTLIIDIYEPHPSEYGLKQIKEYKNINMIDKLDKNYDVLISTDVLEHVPDPLNTFSQMIQSVKHEGYLIIANAFYPMIKCHLPQHFHFRYTFNLFANIMGLEVIGNLENTHATIFKKVSEQKFNWKKIRVYEKISKNIFPFIEFNKPLLLKIKKVIKK